MKIKGVIFDMDGVIVDNHEYHVRSWRQFCTRYGKTLTDEDYKQNINGRTVTDVVKYIFGAELPTEEVRSYSEEKEHIYREMYRPHLQPVHGLMNFLDILEKQGVPKAVATSAPTPNVTFTLDGLGIRDRFDAILDETAVTRGKPDPEVYLKAAAALHQNPVDCLVLEDAISGIKAGLAAGARVIALATTHTPDELTMAHQIIEDFTKVEKLLEMTEQA